MSIQLGEVLFPLRYDVWDQAWAIKELCRLNDDIPAPMLETGRNTAIHRHVVIADPVYQAIGLLKPLAGEDLAHRIERYYAARLKKLADYYRSLGEGWNKGEDMIYFKQVVNPTKTSAGNPVPEGLFLTNGQHRVIALLALGYTALPFYMADIMVRDGADFLPLDMTWPYIQAGECTERDFVRFARLRFNDIPKRVRKIAGLRQWAERTKSPDWLLEYLDIYWGAK